MQNRYVLVIYGCDYGKDGRGLGKETKARIKKALLFIAKQTTPPTAIVLAAGSPPGKNYRPLSSYMALRLFNHFLKEAIRSATFTIPIVIRAEKQYWGTLEETLFAKEIADCYECEHVVVVSSWYHLFRIKLIWDLFTPKMATPIASWKIAHWWSPFLEPIKIFKVFFDWKKRIQKNKKVTSPL